MLQFKNKQTSKVNIECPKSKLEVSMHYLLHRVHIGNHYNGNQKGPNVLSQREAISLQQIETYVHRISNENKRAPYVSPQCEFTNLS